MIETVANDPLVIILCLIVAGVTLSHLAFRRSPLARAIVRRGFLVILTLALFHAGIVAYQPLMASGSPSRDAIHAAFRPLDSDAKLAAGVPAHRLTDWFAGRLRRLHDFASTP